MWREFRGDRNLNGAAEVLLADFDAAGGVAVGLGRAGGPRALRVAQDIERRDAAWAVSSRRLSGDERRRTTRTEADDTRDRCIVGNIVSLRKRTDGGNQDQQSENLTEHCCQVL